MPGRLAAALSGLSSCVLVWEECKVVTRACLKCPSCQDSGLCSHLGITTTCLCGPELPQLLLWTGGLAGATCWVSLRD